MQTVEITAKTVEDATKAAADKLGVAPDRLQVTVLETTKGLFGKSNVRVRAEVKAEAAPAKPEPEPKAETAKPERKGRGKAAPAVEAAPAPEPEAVAPAAEEEAPKKGRRGRGKPDAAPVAEAAPADAPTGEVSEVQASQADADTLVGLVEEILKSGDLAVHAKATEFGGRYVNIELDGKDVAFLVGKHGEVLNAMQYLVNIIASRKVTSGVRATLDGNNYRTRREEALRGLAFKIAEQVKARGEEAVLDALPAFERRIVHKALGEISGVTTYSEGEEPNRRVVIAPAE